MSSITIRDVARLAEVSVATVSRVLNGHQTVAESIRQRVLAAARELHFTPHAGARSLSNRRAGVVGVVLPALAPEFFHDLMRGMDAAARERGQLLLVSAHHADAQSQLEAMRAMHGRVDGIVLMGSADDARAAGIEEPLLQAGEASSSATPAVAIDERAGAFAMLAHLVGQGHRRIAFVAGPPGQPSARERLQGYLDGMARLMPAVEPTVLDGGDDRAAGMRAALGLLAAPRLPDAVFACSDAVALGCLHAFARCGVAVPDSVSVVGFDDLPDAAKARPALTTVRVDGAELGRRAVRRLLAAMESGREDRPMVPMVSEALVPTLVVRDSSAPRGRVSAPGPDASGANRPRAGAGGGDGMP